MGRKLTKEETLYMNSITANVLSRELIKELFANKLKTKAKFDPSDKFEMNLAIFERLLKPLSPLSKEKVLTTVGRFIFNLYMNTGDPFLYKHMGYINTVIDDRGIGKIDKHLSFLLINMEINSDQYREYLNKRDTIAYYVVNFLSPSLSVAASIPLDSVNKRKEELFTKYAKEIEAGDIAIVSKIEKELLDLAEKELKDNPGLDTFKSGARGSFSNNYKNSSIMRGTMFASDGSGRISISKANLMDGIPREEIPFYNDMSIHSFYSKGVETQQGGYIAKQLASAFQAIVIGEHGTDCRTNKTLSVYLRPDNIDKYLFRYIVDGGKFVLLDNENSKKYTGKTVKMRSPMFCTNDSICNRCAGELYYRLGITNVGLTANTIGTTILNKSMKLFHDTTIKVNELNLDSVISEI